LASLESRVEQKKKSIGSADFIGGSATAFSAFKVSVKNGLFLGQMTWVKLVFLEARLRPVEQLDKEVEIGCRSSRMCE
jgi:hypothetical protein